MPSLYKAILSVMIKLMSITILSAQCPNSNQPAPPGDSCVNAPIFCGGTLDGYCSSTTPANNAPLIPAFLGTIENIQFLGFVPTEATVSLEITYSNCLQDDGIQAGIFRTINCNGYALVSSSFYNSGGNGANPGGTFVLTANNLMPGEVYYLLVDGFNKDICDWQVNVLEGIASVPDLTAPATVTGPGMLNGTARVCEGAFNVLFTTTPVAGAASYLWTLPPNATYMPLTADADSILVSFITTTTGQVCAAGRSYCDTSAYTCVNVAGITTAGATLTDTICLGSTYDFNGTALFAAGTYRDTFPSSVGCDSIVTLNLRVQNPVTNGINIIICDGDSVVVGNTVYKTAGFYTTLLQTTAGCDSIVNLSLGVVRADIAPSGILSCGSTMVLDGSQSFGTTYQWLTTDGNIVSGGNTPQVTINQAGTYKLVVSNSACSDTATTVIISQGGAGVVELFGGTLDCFQDSLEFDFNTVSVDTIIILDPTNQPIYTFIWATGETIGSNFAKQAGIYTLIGKDANGCSVSDTTLITYTGITPDAVATGGTLVCGVDSVQLLGSTTTAGATLLWQGPDPTFDATLAQPMVDVAGVYTLTATLGNCTATDTAIVAPATPLTIMAQADAITCTQNSAQLSATANLSNALFSWQGPNGFSQTVANTTTTTAGQYIIIGTLGSCTGRDTVTVTDATFMPSATADGGVIACGATNVSLSGNSTTGGVQYSWESPSGIIINQQNPTVTETGIYTLTVSIGNCVNTDTALVSNDMTLPDVTATGGILTCGTNGVVLVGSSTTNGVLYSWTTPSGSVINQQNPTVSTVGIYTLTVSLGNCVNSDTAIVIPDTNLPMVIATGGIAACGQDSLALQSATANGATLSWTGPDTDFNTSAASPYVTTAGIYTLTITLNGCTNTDTAMVSFLGNAPSVTIQGATNLNCATPTSALSISPAVATDRYNWQGPAGNLGNTATVTATQAGTYVVTVTNANTCTATAEVQVTADLQAPVLTVSADTLDCNTNTVQLQLTNTTASQNISVQWSGNGLSSTLEDPTVQSAGTYTAIATAANQCSDTISVTVIAVAPASLSVQGSTITCAQPQSTLVATTTDAITTYAWAGAGWASAEATPTITTGGTYMLSATTMAGCILTATTTIAMDTLSPTAQAGAPTTTLTGCDGNTTPISLSANGSSTGANMTYQWSTTDGNILSGQQSFTMTTGSVGSYVLLVTNTTNGCSATDVIQVAASSSAAATFDFAVQAPTCSGVTDGSISITPTGGTPPFMYLVNDSIEVSTATFSFLSAGTYDFMITDAAGCITDTTIALPAPQVLEVDLGEDQTIPLGDSLMLRAAINSLQIDTLYWSATQLLVCDTCLQTFTRPLMATTAFRVTVKDDSGCIATDEILVVVQKDRPVFAPTVFTPNNDGFNDVFYLFADASVKRIKRFQVLDRWGEVLHDVANSVPNDPAFGWNGQRDGKPLNPGVFVFFAEVEFIDGVSKLIEGDVTLLR